MPNNFSHITYHRVRDHRSIYYCGVLFEEREREIIFYFWLFAVTISLSMSICFCLSFSIIMIIMIINIMNRLYAVILFVIKHAYAYGFNNCIVDVNRRYWGRCMCQIFFLFFFLLIRTRSINQLDCSLFLNWNVTALNLAENLRHIRNGHDIAIDLLEIENTFRIIQR